METAMHIRAKENAKSQNDSIIIFVTSFTEFWNDAFDVKAFHYLIKPVEKSKFEAVFKRAVIDCKNKNERTEKHIIIKSGDSHHKILLNEIY